MKFNLYESKFSKKNVMLRNIKLKIYAHLKKKDKTIKTS